jgi:5-methylcytosine-specific restriction endonuclease McrA
MQYLKHKAKPTRVNYFQENLYKSNKWRKFRAAIIARRGGECASCGCTPEGRELHLDHIQPLTQGGDRWNSKNIQILCIRCHGRKTAAEVWGVGSNSSADQSDSASASEILFTDDLKLPFL